MSIQLIDGLTNVYNGLSQVVEGVNPLVSTMDDEGNQDIATALLSAGYTEDQIKNFVDVSRVQLDEFLAFEVEIAKRMAVTAKTKTQPRKTTIKKVS